MTLEIKPITSWLVCCRVIHNHSMLRFGIQKLMLWGNCWIALYWAQKSEWKWRVRIAGICMFAYEKWFWSGCYRSYSDMVHVLPGKGEKVHALGWYGGCVQHDHWLHRAHWWKITSANPNGDQLTEWSGSFWSGVVHLC